MVGWLVGMLSSLQALVQRFLRSNVYLQELQLSATTYCIANKLLQRNHLVPGHKETISLIRYQ